MITILLLLVAIVCLPLYILYKPPPFLIHYLQSHYPDILWEVPLRHTNPTTKKTRGGRIALTIDDVPSPQTPHILSILSQYKVHATLFVIGSRIPGNEELLRRAIREGHELGNHGMFDEPSWRLSECDLRREVLGVDEMLEGVYRSAFSNGDGDEDGGQDMDGVPKPPRYFRPGSGFFTTQMRRLIQTLGFRIVLGGVYPHDAQIPYWRVNARHILSLVRPGAIVIVHDGDGRGWTAPMLRRVLRGVKERRMEVGTVGELLESEDDGGE